MKRTRAQALLLLAILALVVAGCGSSSDEDSTAGSTATVPAKEQQPQAATISEQQIAGAKPGTPERAILEWWRDVQVNDPEQALALYVEPPALPDLAGQFNLVSPKMGGSVEVVSVDQEGDPAVAKVRWKQPGGDVRVVTLRLEQSGGWKLVDTRFLDEMVVELQSASSGG